MLVLQRGKETPTGTHGTLYKDGKLVCYTLELQWKANANGISCIPPGVYKVIRHGWEKDATTQFKNVWHLLNVPGREAILIHAGNTTADTHGCILVGLGNTDGGIIKSQLALTKLREILPKEFTLEVRNFN